MEYIKNTTYLVFEKIVRMILWVFVFSWMARYLGPNDFGKFSFVESIISIVVVFTTLGLDSIVIKELVKNQKRVNELLGTAFVLKFLSSIVVIFFIFIYINLIDNEYPINLLLIVISFSFIFHSFNVIDFYFQSKVLSKYVVFSKLIALLVSSSLKIYLIVYSYPLIYFAWVILIESVIVALGLLFFYFQNKFSVFSWKVDNSLIKSLLKHSYPLIFAGVLTTIYAKIDQVMIKEILDVAQSGYYSAAVRLSEIWFIIGGLVCSSFFPLIIKSKDKSISLYYKKIQQLLVFLIFCAYLLIGSVYFLSDFIIVSLYGENFLSSSQILVIHIFSTVFVYMGLVSSKWLVIENKTNLELYRNLIGVIINIGLNFIFIKKFGISGAAYASLITYIFVYYLFDLFLKDTKKMFIIKSKALFLFIKD
ncbi:MAG: flippase [Halarcobacter sp.]